MRKVTTTILLALASLAACSLAVAAGGTAKASGLGGLATNVIQSLGPLAKLIVAGAYVGGMAFVVGAIVKFKAHKDNPTQIPIGTPIALLFVGAALLFAPSLFGSAAGTLWGAGGKSGTISGVTSF